MYCSCRSIRTLQAPLRVSRLKRCVVEWCANTIEIVAFRVIKESIEKDLVLCALGHQGSILQIHIEVGWVTSTMKPVELWSSLSDITRKKPIILSRGW